MSHYETMLAGNYVWVAGGWKSCCERNRDFFATRTIIPSRGGSAIDLGAGCGFQSIPLAEAGFRVTAVEFSRQMLAVLERQTGDLPIRAIRADILSLEAWAGRRPELITCMGDTLTHLPDNAAIEKLIRQGAGELVPKGKIILSFREYSWQPEGSEEIVPVRRDPDRIFLCKLEYDRDTVRVTDILYTRQSGTWTRSAGTYTKLRLAPEVLVSLITVSELALLEQTTESGMVTIIAEKPTGGS